MKTTFLLSAGILLAGNLFAATPEMKTIEDARLFDADYTRMAQDGNGTAQFTKGNAVPTVIHEKRPRFDVEPMEAINHGLLVGEGCASLRYSSKDNLNPQQGSLEILFENRLWDWATDQKHILFQCTGKGTIFYCYKHGMDGLGAYMGMEKPKWSCFPRQIPKRLSGKGLRHFVVTWSSKEICFYLDGILVRDAVPESAIQEFAPYFTVGAAPGNYGVSVRNSVKNFFDCPI
ncbi:MAG: hypothetical protein LBM70_06080 [Victivallales bacterium]|jgi:hypothetical protein|nr:hypothetical protein [Victivallales bacterium]